MAIFNLDTSDWDGMCEIMDKYGDEALPFGGINENGERVLIGVCHDSISIQTFQNNGWLRTNIYNRNGEFEELFDRP